MAVELSRLRINLMRGGYLLMGLGLAAVKWPQVPGAHAMPLYEGVTLCLLVAMSLLALVGAFRPIWMLPILLFETLWKSLWLGLVALPSAMSRGLDDEAIPVAASCSLVVVIIAVTPWRHVVAMGGRRTASP